MRELELKFSLPLSLQDSLARDATPERVERVWSCYYDTPDGALARARMAVRVRRKGERWLQTVKADDGDRFDRFEWERPIAGPAPERDALPPDDTPHGAIVHRTFGQWRPLFETDFERRSRRIEAGPGLAIELARDIGEVRCGDRREQIREVELECLEGTHLAFFEWALDWAMREQACLLMPTKNERGLRLAARLPLAPPPAKAVVAAPPADLAADAAAAAVLRACVSHACANIEPILSADDAEGPHQIRVALRRLRAALRFFELRERDARWMDVDAGAKALADAAGRVRDLDVFETGMLRALRSRFRGDAAIESLSRAVVDARDAARMDLRRTLAGPGTTRFVLGTLARLESLAQGVATAGKADAQAQVDPAVVATPYGAYAGRRLHALLGKVRRRARRSVDADGWHRTRLSVKTLRYSLEFAAQAVPRSVDTARAASLLARWQERLGAGQDLASSRDVAADALSRPGVAPEAAVRAIALIDGWRAFAQTDDDDPLRYARRALRALRDALRAAAPAPDAPAAAAADADSVTPQVLPAEYVAIPPDHCAPLQAPSHAEDLAAPSTPQATSSSGPPTLPTPRVLAPAAFSVTELTPVPEPVTLPAGAVRSTAPWPETSPAAPDRMQ